MPDLREGLREWARTLSAHRDGEDARLWHVELYHGRPNSFDCGGFRPEDLTTLLDDAEAVPGLRAEVERLMAERDEWRREAQSSVKEKTIAERDALVARVIEGRLCT